MKNSIQSIVTFFILCLFTVSAFAQTGDANLDRDVDDSDFIPTAFVTSVQYPYLSTLIALKPSTQVEAKQRQIMIDGRKLLNQIVATKGRANNNQIMAYKRQLLQLERALDLTFGGLNGKPIYCQSCTADYPHSSWKRFWCKIGCIRIASGNGGN